MHGPEAPVALAYLLDWYYELAEGRSVGMNGVNPVSYQDIDAWARLTGRTPQPHEVRALMRLDHVARHPPDADNG